jgi:hypothetical protein
MSASNGAVGFSNGDGFKPLDGRRRALDIFQIDTNFKQVVYKKQAKTRELLMDKLSNHPLFDKLDKRELGEIVDAMKSVNIPRNQVSFQTSSMPKPPPPPSSSFFVSSFSFLYLFCVMTFFTFYFLFFLTSCC